MALERRLFERKRTVLIEESMDRLEFLVEERSMAEVLKVLLPRILPASWVLDENYFIRPHEGKSDLKRSIPKKLKGFAQHKEQTTGFIIIQDQDSNDCRQLKQELVALCKANQAPNIKFLVRIVCHELEAWYLGDMKAIQAVFPRFNPARHLKKSLFRLPDTCQNPKTRLKDIVILSADLAVIFFKYQTSSSSINRSSNGLLILLLKVSAMWTYLSVVLILLCPISSFTILMSVPCSSR